MEGEYLCAIHGALSFVSQPLAQAFFMKDMAAIIYLK